MKHVRDITQGLDMLEIWCKLPHDMRLVMHHVVGVFNLIQSLRDVNQLTSSFDQEILSVVPHHDSPPSHGS